MKIEYESLNSELETKMCQIDELEGKGINMNEESAKYQTQIEFLNNKIDNLKLNTQEIIEKTKLKEKESISLKNVNLII